MSNGFKTKEEIEEMAKESFSRISIMRKVWTFVDGFKDGYTQAQQDIKEACSKSFNDWLWGVNFGGTTQNEISRMKLAWQAAKLSSMKELQEKDEEIKEIKEAMQTIYDNSRANYIDTQEKEKFRQIVEKYKLHKY